VSDGPDLLIERTVARDHPAFAGHFPGAPVLPGACVLALVLQAAVGRPALATPGGGIAVQQVKFLAPVGPGQTLAIELHDGAGGVAFHVRCGTTTVARGQLAPAA
jgi:3-hydroxyacyl-[acyl-carrier-protein] dehydratase